MRKRWLVIGVTVLTIVVASLLFNFLLAEEKLTQKEIEEVVQARYPGNIVHSTQQEGIYVFELQMKAGTYEVQVDAISGEIVSLIQKENTKAEEQLLDEQQAEAVILSEMEGEIESLTLVTENETFVYKAVTRNGGEKTTITLDAVEGTILKSETEVKEEVTSTLTEAQAGEVAIQHIGEGEIDDIDLEETNSRSYYLIEVEVTDDREATVQVNAISGEVMSVAWDD